MDKFKSILETAKLVYDIFGNPPIDYITNPEKKMEQLDKNAQWLYARRDDLEKITRESPNVETRESRLWLEDVKKLEVEVNSIKGEHTRCSIFSRLMLGKQVGDVIEEITDLNNKRPKLKANEFSNAPLDKVEPKSVEFNSSTDSKPRLQKILGLLQDVNFRKIGIWGMCGIGKTRTLRFLNNRLDQESRMFDIVIWVTVSEEGSQRKVQNDIVERLKCFEKDMFDDQLKSSICRHLTGKKFLLILDDIWERIDLDDVGIPTLTQDNGCKVLLTTRDLAVCRRMETDVEIPMEKLSEEEAWSLFNEKAGDVALSPCIEPIARDIVKKCSGLPLAIIVIGSSLRKISYVRVWRNTLRKLQLLSTSQIKGTEMEVFSCLRVSYERLSEDSERNLFLYCSLYPEDSKILITQLVEYCWLEGYIQGVDSIEEARNDGHHMVMNLVDASLLERVRHSEKYVKMNDIIRDFALKEASGFLVKTDRHVKHPPKKEWLQSQKISLMGSSLGCLPEMPNCESLSTLLLRNIYDLAKIPNFFFECMHSLCILDLSGTRIESLPSSLCNLVKIRGLYLQDCYQLKELPSQVGALTQLQILDLGGNTTIKYLPGEVGELTHLKCLIVGFVERNLYHDKEWNMKLRVPTGIIPKLPYLEELSLYVYHSSQRNCVEKGQWDDESMEVVVEELCRLEHLTSLNAYFPKVECLEHFLCQSKLMKATSSWFRRFQFRVGSEITFAYQPNYMRFENPDNRRLVYKGGLGDPWDRCLVYKGGLGMSHAAITETLAHCSYFRLQHHRTAKKLSEFGLANMNELKECWITGCDEMETLFNGDEQQETCALLPNLEILELGYLPGLRSLCDGPLLPGTLCKLRALFLYRCHNLKKLFQLGIIRQLRSLESLSVSDCSTMEEIIEIEEEMSMAVASNTHNVISHNNDRLILPNIKTIDLYELPELISICRGFSNFEWPSLETIEFDDCPKLKSLSFLSNCPKLKSSLSFLSNCPKLKSLSNDSNLFLNLGNDLVSSMEGSRR